MEFQDHAYTTTTTYNNNPAEFTYKMSSKEVEEFVKLRVSNNYLFSGRRNTSMLAWRAILKHMGLQHKMTHSQASKKWENMKKRYKDLKSPPVGVKVFPETWPHFTLMDNALQGRLEGSAPILKALVTDKDSDDFLPVCKSKKRKVSMDTASSTASVAGGPEIEVSLNGDEDGEQGCMDIDRIMLEVDNERNVMDNERQAMAKEKQLMDRERQVLQRERAVLDREVATLDRDRASLERERAMIEREKVVMEREKAMVERDKDAVCRERQALEREKARLKRLYGSKERTEEVTEDTSKDTDIMDRKERFLYLFEKLIESF